MHFELYTRLGFEEFKLDNAPTSDEIKKAYRTLSKSCHPDLFPGNENKKALFLSITEAYEILMDEEKRAEYDKSGIILNNNEERAMFINAVNNIMSTIVKIVDLVPQEEQLDNFDVKQVILDNVEVNKNNMKQEIAKLQVFISRMRRVLKNLKTKSSDDPIAQGINKAISEKNIEILNHNKAFKVLAMMEEILNNYDYETIKYFMTNNTNTTTSAASGFRGFSIRMDGI